MEQEETMTTALHISTEWERPALPTGDGAATLMIRIVAPVTNERTATTRSAVDLAFIIDRSGSMDGRPIELAKQAVSQAAGMLDRRDRAALVVYDDHIDLIHPLSPVDSRNRNELRLGLAHVDARGSTNLCDGGLTGCRELARHDTPAGRGERIRRAILLTDGLANVGERSPAVIFRHATELRQRGISTTTLGMGTNFDDSLLSGMAEAGGGNYVYLESASQLAHTFERELGRLTAIAATRLNLRLRLPDGLHGELVSRFPIERSGHRFDIAIDDLVAGDEVVLIFDVTSRDLRAGDRLPIECSLRWTDPISGERRTDASPIESLDVIEDRIYAAMPRIQDVSAQAAIQHAALDQRRAMELDRAGRYAESRALHTQAFDVLSAAPLQAADQHLRDEAQTYASYDGSTAFSEHDRKRAAADSFGRTRRRRVSEE
jgi:Ca-activated chloride channel family protein